MRASAASPVSCFNRLAAALAVVALVLGLLPLSSAAVEAGQDLDRARWIGGLDDLQPAKLERGARLETERAISPGPAASTVASPSAAEPPGASGVDCLDPADGEPAHSPASFRRPQPTGPPTSG